MDELHHANHAIDSIGDTSQDPVLFSGTLRHNLDPFEQFTEGRILEALRVAGLAEMVAAFPKKLEHQITDEGRKTQSQSDVSSSELLDRIPAKSIASRLKQKELI